MTDVAEAFEWYADWASDVSPLYERLADVVAGNPELLDVAAEARDGQPPPQLLLAAVHALLLRGRTHRLAAYYPTCSDDPRPVDDDLPGAFREFCLENEAALRTIVGTRRVQTNEVGRSAALLPAFGHVDGTTDAARLATVEVGASAGLNLFWDRFRYEYGGYGARGARRSPVTVASSVRGPRDPPFPDGLPEVAARVGIDLEPLDVTDPDDVTWLRALVVPDQRRRHERLSAAIDLVADDPPALVAGDALETLPGVLADLPAEAALCVFSTLTLYQFTGREVAALRRLLADVGTEREVHWLSGDPSATSDRPTLRHVAFRDGDASERRLVTYESSGECIRWVADT